MLNLLLFVTTYISGFLLAVLHNPIWAFLLYQVVYFMNPLNRWWSGPLPGLSYSMFTVLLMFAVFVIEYKQHAKNKLLKAPQFKWMYLIAVGYIVAQAYASLPALNQEAATNYIKMVIILSVAYKLVDTDMKLSGILWAYIAGAGYLGFLIYQTGRNAAGRVEGVGTVDAPDANGIAAAIAPSLVLALYYFWISKKLWARGLIVLAGAFIGNAIVLINSRASFIAVIIGVGYFLLYMFFSKHQRDKQKASAVMVVLLGLLAASVVIDETAINRFFSIKEQQLTEEQETGATRVFFWLAAMEMVKDHPLGAGAFGFEAHAPDYLPRDMDTGGSRNRSVHSSWFEALTDLGFPGIFFLIMMIKACFWSTRRAKRAVVSRQEYNQYYKVVAIEAAFITFIVAMSFMNRFRAEILYWCVLFTACAYNIYVLKYQNQSIPKKRRPLLRTADHATE
ncbi:MAG: O-antigen polymerase [Pseudomonadales bacterium]|nr:O-antigen polymerase [Pseudomonadales bacterium]